MTDTPNLRNDPANANRGTVRGLGMVERSLQQYGAGRSILASKDGIILAGNKTYDRAMELGIPVQEIESDGKTLFVIKRTDLAYDDPRAKELAIADNRASETGLDWDADVLAALADDGVDLSQFWFEPELDRVLGNIEDGDFNPADEWEGMPEFHQDDMTALFQCKVNFASMDDVAAFEERIGQHIPRDRKSIWYPPAEIGRYGDKAYVEGDDD